MAARIDKVRLELRDDSTRVATSTPRISWTVAVDEPDWRQAGADLRCGGEEHHHAGSESVLVAWPFSPLAPGETRSLSVRAAAESGTVTDWSEEIVVDAGFIADDTWIARPIGVADPGQIGQPVLLRREFRLDRPVRRARLYWTALGSAQIEVNGADVDDAVLAPGWTSFTRRLVHETVDLTASLSPGVNAVGIWLAGAWYTENYGFGGDGRTWGEQPALIAQLHLDYTDGSSEIIATDQSWRVNPAGPITASGIYAGEHYDARRELPGWSSADFDDSDWAAATIVDTPTPIPQPRISAPVRRVEERPVAEVFTSPSGALLVDFGQNLVGWLKLRVTGPAGTTITLRHAEVLENGELALRPLRHAAATDSYTLRGGGEETWEPRFTFHGFRYAQIDGWPGTFDPAAVTAVVVGSDNTRTGWFTSSHDLLNKLHDNVVWGMRGNFLSVPSDCPQRDERLGWTGDIQVFSPTASFLYDVDGFLTSWLRDLAVDQAATDGYVPLVIPDAQPWLGRAAVAAWGDAATVVPWVLYQRFGDLGVLGDQYASMRSWVDTMISSTDGDGLWDEGVQLGDWLDPSAPPDKPDQAKVDGEIVATAYLAYSLQIVADTAALLGHRDDADRYAKLAADSRDAFTAQYVTPNGRMMSDAPTAYALVLGFDLVGDPELRQRLSDRLAELVRANGYRIGTGFVGTPLVMDGLSGGGHLYPASRLLLQTQNPSWLYPVTQGATTVWERWDSLLEDGTVNPGEMTSFNHYALGAVADWLHRVVGGLAPVSPGYRQLQIKPRTLPGLDHAEARHVTPYGLAEVAWRRHGDRATVTAVVPPNTTAVVDLGDDVFEVGSGRHEWTMAAGEQEPAFAGPFTLDTDLGSVIDNPRAYQAFVDAVNELDTRRASGLRHDPVWHRGRNVRYALLFADPALIDRVERSLAAITD